MFFGVHEDTEEKEKAVWMGRRRRLASRKYGNLKAEYQDPTQVNTGPFEYFIKQHRDQGV